jgi:hypothetical protein
MFANKVMGPKVAKLPTLRILGLPLGSPGTKRHFNVGLMARKRIYYKGVGGGFLQVQVVVNLMNLNLPMAHLNTKNIQTMH